MTTDQVPRDRLPRTITPDKEVLLPDQYDPGLIAQLDHLDATSGEWADTLRPRNTQRGYEADWKAWGEFAESFGVPVTAAVRVGALRAYVTTMWEKQGLSAATIDRRLAGLAVTLRKEHGVVINPDHTKAARQLLKDLSRRDADQHKAERGRGKAPAVTVGMLRSMVAACPDTLTGVRDRAILLVGFSIAARRHELSGLSVRSLVPESRGMKVNVRVSKTEPRTVRVPHAKDKVMCPVRAWEEWLSASGITDRDTPAFRRMHRTGSVTKAGLSPQSVGTVVTESGERAGLPYRLTGHSLRAGLITEARRIGKDRKAISATSGHVDGSPVMDGYIRDVDGWAEENNAVAGLL